MKLAIAFVLCFAAAASAQATRPVQAVLKIGMTVDNMDRSLDFYTKVLDFKKLSDDELVGEEHEQRLGVFGLRIRVVNLQLGRETIELTEFLTPRGRTIPRDSRSNDRWFQHIAIVTTDMDKAYQRLREARVGFASTGPQTLPAWNQNAGGIRAFYFRDPDDHVLEVISFPPGKGDPRWQSGRDLFAGIDHTAIVVQNTEQSLGFYRDVLGFRVAGNSENYGPEQERLNNVEGARLRITTLKAPAGPGVEFLEYLTPTDGRPYPGNAKANDLFHWHTTIGVTDAAGLLKDLKGAGHRVTGTLVRDPDGHAVQVLVTP